MDSASNFKFFILVKTYSCLILVLILLVVSCSTTNGIVTNEEKQKENKPVYFSSTEIQYADKIYKDNIKTVLFYNSDSEIDPPIIEFNSAEYVSLRFDDLDNSVKTFNYSILHCNADWTPSTLMEIEYLDGYFQGNITNYDYSFNTYEPYIHYKVDFPNNNSKLLLPGNYVFFVYENNDKENPVLTRRFMVYQPKFSLKYQYKASDDVEERNYKQEIDFTVNLNGTQLNNGYSDLTAVELQNFRWDNAIVGMSPKFISGNELVYNLDEPQTFYGLNEFRHFSQTSTSIKGNKVMSIAHDSTLYNIALYADDKRTYKKYLTTGDVNGQFKIHRDNATDNHTGADYMYVSFTLDYNTAPKDGDIYIFGKLTDWQIKPEFKMNFSETASLYSQTVKLKQGSYDYMYVYVPQKGGTIDNTFIEGTHFVTENQYAILIYYKDIRRSVDLLYGYIDFDNQNK